MLFRSALYAVLLVNIAGCKSATKNESSQKDSTDITNTLFSPGAVTFSCGNGKLHAPCWNYEKQDWEPRPVSTCTMTNKNFGALMESDTRKFCNVNPRNEGPGQPLPPPPPAAPTDPFKNPAACARVGDTWQATTLATSGAVNQEFTAANPGNADINSEFCNQVGIKLVYIGKQKAVANAIQSQAILIVSIGPKSTPVTFKSGALTVPWTLDDTAQAKAIMLIDAMTSQTNCSSGVPVGGTCWFRGNNNESCDNVCAKANLKFDPLTCRNISKDFCGLMREMLSITLNQQEPLNLGLQTGCGIYTYSGAQLVVDQSGCTPTAHSDYGQRFCACKPQ